MPKEYLIDKILELKDRFKSFFQHRKKISALENYSVAEKFQHKNYLPLIKTCMNEGFLDEEESKFLDHMLKRYEINYLDWSHKTKWIKNQMESLKPRKALPIQTFFDFDKKESSTNIPFELLINSAKQQVKRV